MNVNMARTAMNSHRISGSGFNNEVRSSLKILGYLKNPTKETQLRFMNIDSFAIRYIANPDLEIQRFVVDNCPQQIEYVNNPYPEIQVKFAKIDPWSATRIWKDIIVPEAWDIAYDNANHLAIDVNYVKSDIKALYESAPDESRKVLVKMRYGEIIN